MLACRIIPCLDVRDGVVVKGVQFSDLREMGDPAERAAIYQLDGADEIVILDVSATLEGRLSHQLTIQAVRSRLSIPLTTGGGVRAAVDAQVLLEAGADKVAVNTTAVLRPEILSEIAESFGSQCCVLALDAARIGGLSDKKGDETEDAWEVVTHSGKQKSGKRAAAWAKEAEERGAGEIVLTSWDRDGTRSGYDLELIRAVRRAVRIPVIASGGASTAAHCVQAVQAGADAVLAASIFHENQYTSQKLKREMAEQGVYVRL